MMKALLAALVVLKFQTALALLRGVFIFVIVLVLLVYGIAMAR